MSRRIAFLGGNGHCAARLAAAREAALRVDATGTAIELLDVPYPGFEGRPRAATLEAFLDHVAPRAGSGDLMYATGIGGLIALALRARGALEGVPLILQAPVLWGLEKRIMPRLMRSRPASHFAHALFATQAFQALFVRRFFVAPLSAETRAAFFRGYAGCAALPDLFAWLTPDFLRSLEARLAGRAGATEGITVWWGGRDPVVSLEELAWTEPALRVRWPCRVFPEWGHYPMIEAPEAWIAALAVPKVESVRLDADGAAAAAPGSSR